MSRLGDRVRAWLDYDAAQDLRLAARSAAVDRDMDLAGVTRDDIAAAVRRGTTTLRTYPTTLLKPQDIDRVTDELMAVLKPPATWRLDIFDTNGEVGDVDAIRRGVTR